MALATDTTNNEKVKAFRQSRHWTQEELAEASGLTLPLIGKIEKGHRITYRSAVALSKVMRCSWRSLIQE